MAIDWHEIAGEVHDALRSVGQTEEGHVATLRRQTTSGGNAWTPGSSGSPAKTYHPLTILEGFEEVRDASGTLVGQTRHTLTVSAVGVALQKGDAIAVGVKAEDAGEHTPFVAITAVRPLAPAGVAVLYEVDLQA